MPTFMIAPENRSRGRAGSLSIPSAERKHWSNHYHKEITPVVKVIRVEQHHTIGSYIEPFVHMAPEVTLLTAVLKQK